MEIILLIFSVPILLFVGYRWWDRSREATAYNGGICTECPGSPMHSFDADDSGWRGYRCDTCYRRIWVSYTGVDGG